MASFYAWGNQMARCHQWGGSAPDLYARMLPLPCRHWCFPASVGKPKSASWANWKQITLHRVPQLGSPSALEGQREDNTLVGTGTWLSWQSWSRITPHTLMVWHYGHAAAASVEMLLKGYSPASPLLVSHLVVAEPHNELPCQALLLLGKTRLFSKVWQSCRVITVP